MDDPDPFKKLLAAGVVERKGDQVVFTEKGRAALRREVPGYDRQAARVQIEPLKAQAKARIAMRKRRK